MINNVSIDDVQLACMALDEWDDAEVRAQEKAEQEAREKAKR